MTGVYKNGWKAMVNPPQGRWALGWPGFDFPPLPFMSSVTLGKLLNLSGPPFSLIKWQDSSRQVAGSIQRAHATSKILPLSQYQMNAPKTSGVSELTSSPFTAPPCEQHRLSLLPSSPPYFLQHPCTLALWAVEKQDRVAAEPTGSGPELASGD